jgi:tripartite-type tricarboxylate transporter receptor subunit TctC
MFTRRQAVGSLLAASASPLLGDVAFANDPYPSQTIKSICSFAPGSGADIVVRFYAMKLQEICGKPVIVENKVGAAGNIATEFVARSKPDGYTIYICPATNVLASAPYFFKKLNFDPVEDFEHVTTLHKAPLLLVVAADSPYKSAGDLAAQLKPQGSNVGYAAISNSAQVCCELFKAQFGLDTAEVRFRDFPSALREMATGAVAYTYLDAPQAQGHMSAGRIRALATTASERTSALPISIPTAAEAGINTTDIMFWWSVQVAKGTPRPIVDKLGEWFSTIIEMDDTKRYLAQGGSVPFPGTPDATKALLKKEVAAWAHYTKVAKVEAQ